MLIRGNIVTAQDCFYGELEWENECITKIRHLGERRKDTSLILAGFIDTHFHGMGPFDAENPDSLEDLAEYAAQKGITSLTPAYSALPQAETVQWLEKVRTLALAEDNGKKGAKIAGSHLEGPWLSCRFKGGMREDMLRNPSMEEAEIFLKASGGTLKTVTLAPELPGSREVIAFLKKNHVNISLGHSDCPPEKFPEAVECGISQVCHIFDAYDVPECTGGVRQAALTDMILIDDRVMIEIILDGLHVPPALVHLVRKAAGAGRIIGITDALQGAGLASGRFLCEGRWYVIKDGDVGRLEDTGGIVGSSLTMNRAFFNMVTRFGFSVEEASLCLSGNPAKSLNMADTTGLLAEGRKADIAVLAPDLLTVEKTIVNGKTVYEGK